MRLQFLGLTYSLSAGAGLCTNLPAWMGLQKCRKPPAYQIVVVSDQDLDCVHVGSPFMLLRRFSFGAASFQEPMGASEHTNLQVESHQRYQECQCGQSFEEYAN